MGDHQQSVEHAVQEAKRGDWEEVLALWQRSPDLARMCSRYQKPSSGWTFLHQAAYFNHEVACRELIRLGAAVGALSHDRQRPADVAANKIRPWRRSFGTPITMRSHFGALPRIQIYCQVVANGMKRQSVVLRMPCKLHTQAGS